MDVSNYLVITKALYNKANSQLQSVRDSEKKPIEGESPSESAPVDKLAALDTFKQTTQDIIRNSQDLLILLKEMQGMVETFINQQKQSIEDVSAGHIVLPTDSSVPPPQFRFPGARMDSIDERDSILADTIESSTRHLLQEPRRELHWEAQRRERDLEVRQQQLLQFLSATPTVSGDTNTLHLSEPAPDSPAHQVYSPPASPPQDMYDA